MVRKIGLMLFFIGIISVAMQLMGFQDKVIILSWITHWGEATAWGLRGALICIGGGLMFLDNLVGDEGLEGEVLKK